MAVVTARSTSKQLRYFCFDRETSLASIGCRIHHQDNHQEVVSETILRIQACHKTGFHKRDRTVVLAQTMAVSAATSMESDRKTYPPKFRFRRCNKLDETQAQPFRNLRCFSGRSGIWRARHACEQFKHIGAFHPSRNQWYNIIAKGHCIHILHWVRPC